MGPQSQPPDASRDDHRTYIKIVCRSSVVGGGGLVILASFLWIFQLVLLLFCGILILRLDLDFCKPVAVLGICVVHKLDPEIFIMEFI